MATRKKHTPEQVVRKLATADRMLNDGKDVADVCRELSRARGRRGGCVLRAPGGPVDLDRYPIRGGSRVDQVKRCVRAGVGE